jgi:hypothetical protein
MTAATMLVDVRPDEEALDLVDYLRRLGCHVERVTGGRLSVSIAYPETVDDETDSLRAWCESWSGDARTAVLRAIPRRD